VEIAPESLRREETNVGNYLGDLARMLQFKGIGYTADAYHLLHQPGASPDDPDFWRAEMPYAPLHVHISTSDRTWRVSEERDLKMFSMRLLELGYGGRVSLECKWEDFEAELPVALAQVRGLF
jgi:hypothetical protein